MKPKTCLFSSRPLLFSSAIALASSLTWQASAATYYWDPSATAGFGTATGGTWGSNSYWNTSSTGAVSTGTTATTVIGDSVNFGTGSAGLVAGSVGVSTSGVTATNITFGALSGNIALTTTSSSTITLGAAATITTNNTSDSIAPILAGAATSLTKAGTGTLILTGANSYSGTTIISAGVLQAAEGVGLPANFLSLNGGIFQSNSTAAFTRSIASSGISTFQFTANGGGFSANGGQLTVNIGGASAEQVWGATVGTNIVGTLKFGSATANSKTIVQNGIDLNTATRTIDVTNGAGGDSAEISGNIRTSTGSAGLTKTGTGTLVLSGSNTYDGVTTVSGGTLRFTAPGALYSGTDTNWIPANLIMASGATLATNIGGGSDFSDSQVNTLLTNLTAITSNGLQTGSSFGFDTTNATGDVTYSHILADSTGTGGGAVGYTKLGAGTLILDQANTYTGTTTAASGTLKLTGNRTAIQGGLVAGSVGGETGTMEISNGSFSTGTGDISIGSASGAVGVINQTSGTVATTSTTTTNGRMLMGAAVSSTATYNLSGGSLTITGAGSSASNGNSLILGTASTTTTTFNLSGSASLVMTPAGAGTYSILHIGRSNSTTTGSGGTFNQSGTSSASIVNLGMGNANNTSTTSVLNITGGTFAVSSAFTVMAAGATSTASITIGGTADVTLPAFPTARGASSTATITFDGGTLRPTAASAVYMGGLTSATIQDGGITIDVPTTKDITVTQALLTHPSSLGGGLTKTGVGTLTLTGANTYTGATAVNDGTLALVGGSQASPITVANGAFLGFTIGSTTASTSTVTLGSTAKVKITGTPTLASYTLMTTAGITGTPVLDTAISGYALVVDGTSLKLNSTASYGTWAAANGTSQTIDLDHDNDGVSNGVEYFIGGPSGVTTGFTPLPAVVNTAGVLSITWTKAASYTGTYGTDFVVETSSTLIGTWTTETVGGNVTITGNDVKYTFPVGTRGFARLKVTGP